MSTVEEEIPAPLVFTDAAATKVGQLLQEEDNPNLNLRVYVTGGAVPAFSMALPSTKTKTRATRKSKTAG
jgi:Fe-S cluster assembly iron-binding protein IscA